ncbi:hypothetical protein HPB49_014337 [Dermacentor silvarum]|uniref:Uncharacterized protein n=1 Tax=Dermacentor silvarum TaxID=543639 RepID=A0ACB8CFN5_DERSI|nr:hypothetical protein HPB49_014337 [Dermacentor silvarum]
MGSRFKKRYLQAKSSQTFEIVPFDAASWITSVETKIQAKLTTDVDASPSQPQEESTDCAGDWLTVKRRKQRSKEAPKNTDPAAEAQQRSPRRPPPLPKQHLKVILRPREGLVFSKWPTPVIARAVLTAGGYPRTTPTQNLIVRIESKQNIAVVSTSSEDMEARIRDINTVHLGAKEYAVATYIAPPADSARGIPQGTTDAELIRGLYAHKRNILQARMLGPCATTLITFEGRTVPRYITFDGGEIRCLPYRHTVKVCNACHQMGHRADVCPYPDKPTCERCGAAERSDGHDCKLKCSLCDGDHATASKECPKRLPPAPRSSHRPLKEQAHRDNTTTEQPRKGRRQRSRSRTRSRSRPRAASQQRGGSRSRSRSESRSRSKSRTRSGSRPKTLSHVTSKEQQVSWAERCLPKSQRQNDKTKPHIQPSRDADTNTNTVQTLAALVQELRVEIAELRAQLKEERSRNKSPAQESSPEPRTPPQPPQRVSTASVAQETVEEMNIEAPPEPNPTAQPIDVRVTACEKGIHENRKAIQELHMRMEKGFDEIRQMITHLHEVFTPLVNDQRHKKPRVYPHREAALQQKLQEDQNGQKTE